MVLKITFTIPERSVTRNQLEYPTEDVSYVYLLAINKARYANRMWTDAAGIRTIDPFGNKAVESALRDGGSIVARESPDNLNAYRLAVSVGNVTADFYIQKRAGGPVSNIAVDAVDLTDIFHPCKFSLDGSTLKGYRVNFVTPRITATDTSHVSGLFGVAHYDVSNRPVLPMTGAVMKAPSSQAPPALVILEVEVEGSGLPEDPYRPRLLRRPVEIPKLEGLPGFLYMEAKRYEMLKSKGFTEDEMRLLLGYTPKHEVDLYSINWGAFEFNENSPTNVIVVTENNQYNGDAMSKQVELASSRNLKVLKPPKDYGEAIEQYNQLKKDYPYWLSGKDNYAYQTLGLEELDVFQSVDFYYGELIEHKRHFDRLKEIPDWELRRNLKALEDKLRRIKVLTEERDKHYQKLKEIKKLGW
jgi:hypothetical protein